jgi:hypothetical protein
MHDLDSGRTPMWSFGHTNLRGRWIPVTHCVGGKRVGLWPYYAFVRGFATSRAQSMKSFATGLIVLFLSVTIPTDLNLG